ncbi:MAG: hypothetical protein LAO76_08325 [Acidobacteriia bacterium]|nr:hypothetical protein [Terriglobia bacterium]
MVTFPAFLGNFETYPKDGIAHDFLSTLLGHLKRVDYVLSVADPSRNPGQMMSDLDKALEKSIVALGALSVDFPLPLGVPQELDFAFEYAGRTIAVEIEKTNQEKILRDILKCHMYLHCGADFAIVALPKNYPHKLGVWNLFELVCRDSKNATPTDSVPDRILGGFFSWVSNSSMPSPTSLYLLRQDKKCVAMQLADDWIR